MAFLSLGAQGASLATGLMAAQTSAQGAQAIAGFEAQGATTTAAQTAHAAKFQGAVDANKALINAENNARAAEARAEAEEFNAVIADQMAESETKRAGAEANDFRRAQSARAASAKARQAASGIALEGSPLMVSESIFQEIEFGAQRLVHAGQVASTRLTNQGKLLRRSALLEKATAANLREAGKKSSQWSQDAGEIMAQGALTAGDIRARGAILGGNIKASAAKLEGVGNAFRSIAGMGQTLSTMGINWGGGSGGKTAIDLMPMDI